MKSAVRTALGKAEKSLKTSPDQGEALVKEAVQTLDRAARKGVIHPNKAARHKSRLMKRLKAAAPQAPKGTQPPAS